MDKSQMFVLLIPILLFSASNHALYAHNSIPPANNQNLLSAFSDFSGFFSGLINGIANAFGAPSNSTPSTASSNATVTLTPAMPISGGTTTLPANSTFSKVYVGGNLTSGLFRVQLQDLGVANANGISPAAIAVYYNGILTNTSSILPPSTMKFTVRGQSLYVTVNQTFSGYYTYQKWATIRLSYSSPATTTVATTTIPTPTSQLSKVYVGGSLTRGPFTVQLKNIGAANSNGVSPAVIAIYYGGTLTPNTASITPLSTMKFTIKGQNLYVTVNQTHNAYYIWYFNQQWAMMALSSSTPATTTTMTSSITTTTTIPKTTSTSVATTTIPPSTLSKVYVGGNLTSGLFRVQLQDLGVANANGISPAAIAVYYNSVLTNSSSILPPSTMKFTVRGQSLYVTVNQTFSGYYAYQKWAMMALSSPTSTTSTTSSVTTTSTTSSVTISTTIPSTTSTVTTTAPTTTIIGPGVSNTYNVSALIGSVLNGAVILGAPASTKYIQGQGPYSFQELGSLTLSTAASPYLSGVPFSTSVTPSYNGGGVHFTTFSNSAFDNIMQVTSAQLPTLLNNAGNNGETESLWITGFPVYDQASGINNFQLLDAGGAYQITFNKPILFNGAATSVTTTARLNVPILLLGQSWTIVAGYGAGAGKVSFSNTVAGGQIQLLGPHSNIINITNGRVFNQTTNPGWYVTLLWTNTSRPSSGNAVALQSIILYNTTPSTLSPGRSFPYIESPSAYKLTFLPDAFNNFDAITATSSTQGQFAYQNLGTGTTITNITEPAQELTVTSQIPNAFNYAGQTGSSVVYDLTPYSLNAAGPGQTL